MQKNSAYAKYRHKYITQGCYGNGRENVHSITTQRMSLADEENDVDRPTMDLEKGSKDSEEELQGAGANTKVSVQVPSDLEIEE